MLGGPALVPEGWKKPLRALAKYFFCRATSSAFLPRREWRARFPSVQFMVLKPSKV